MAIVLVRSQLMQHLHVTPQRAPARTEGNEADLLGTRRRGRSTRVENVARTDEPSRRHACSRICRGARIYVEWCIRNSHSLCLTKTLHTSTPSHDQGTEQVLQACQCGQDIALSLALNQSRQACLASPHSAFCHSAPLFLATFCPLLRGCIAIIRCCRWRGCSGGRALCVAAHTPCQRCCSACCCPRPAAAAATAAAAAAHR